VLRLQRRLKEDRVVSVRPSMHKPMGMSTAPVSTDHSSLAWPDRSGSAGSLTTSRTFAQSPVDGDLGKVEADDLVVGTDRVVGRISENPAASHSSRRIR
jgi:hypothetical protein